MSQQYDDQIIDWFTLNNRTLTKEFGAPKGMHYMELYDDCPEFRQFIRESFLEACDAWNSRNPYEEKYN
jgi:beta-glucosidase/6-phospho-beta-glucosidase/beta-galactosidase